MLLEDNINPFAMQSQCYCEINATMPRNKGKAQGQKESSFTLSITMLLLPTSFFLTSSLNKKRRKKRGVINK